MHISLMVHANWLKDNRIIHANRLRQLLDARLRLAFNTLMVESNIAVDAQKRCDEEMPVTVKAIGMPESGELRDGFALARQAENCVKAFKPASDEWAHLPETTRTTILSGG